MVVINWTEQELMEWTLLAPSTGLSVLLNSVFVLPWVISPCVSVSLSAGVVSTWKAQASSCSLVTPSPARHKAQRVLNQCIE